MLHELVAQHAQTDDARRDEGGWSRAHRSISRRNRATRFSRLASGSLPIGCMTLIATGWFVASWTAL